MNIWWMMVAAGALTYLTRLSFIWLFERVSIPVLLQRALRLVPPAVLSVIIFQELLIRNGAVTIALDNARLPAGLIAMLIAWRTCSALLTIAAGMIALWVINWILV